MTDAVLQQREVPSKGPEIRPPRPRQGLGLDYEAPRDGAATTVGEATR